MNTKPSTHRLTVSILDRWSSSLGWEDRQLIAEALGRTRAPAALGPLLGLFSDSDYDVRMSAAKALGMIGQPGAIPSLRRKVEDDSNRTVRAFAAEALAKLEEPTDRAQLLTMVEDGDPLMQYRGACGLLKSGDSMGIEVHGKLTHHEEESVQRIAAAALCGGNVSVPAELLLTMTKSETPYVRACAAKALGRLQGPLALPALLRLAGDDGEFQLQADGQELFGLGARKTLKVQAVVVAALVSFDDPQTRDELRKLAAASDQKVRQVATKALAVQDGTGSDQAALSWTNDFLEPVRQAAVKLLNLMRTPHARDTLLALADDPSANDVRRASALAALGTLHDSSVLDRLLSGLEDPAWKVQWGAAAGLEAMAQQAVESLIRRIDEIADSGEMARTMWLLDNLGNPATVRPAILAHGTADLAMWKRTAADAVEAGDRTVMGSLIAALQNANPQVRESAASALGALGHREAVTPLMSLLGDPEWQVRLMVISTLSRIGTSDVALLATALDERSTKVRAGAAEVLGALRVPEAVAPLIRALDDPCRLVRASAAEALDYIGDPRAVGSLIRAMQDPDRGVRNVAAMALHRIGTPEALTVFREWTLARRRHAVAEVFTETKR